MPIDDDYPELSKLVKDRLDTTLDALGRQSQQREGFVDLRYCCALILHRVEREPWVPDAYGYMATIEKFLHEFPPDESKRKSLWSRLGRRGTEIDSAFLDVVAEATMSVQLSAIGQKPVLEQKFDPTDAESKNADIVLCDDAAKMWGDVCSIRPTKAAGDPLRVLAQAAADKYHDKFNRAVADRLVGSACVFVCVLNREDHLALPFVAAMPAAPEELWRRCPKLDVVYVYSLQKLGFSNSDVLVPSTVAYWSRPKA